MNKLIISDSFNNADLFYLTKILVPDPFIFLQTSSKSYALVNSMEYNRIKKQAPRNLSVLSQEKYINKKKKNTLASIALLFLREKKIKSIEVPYDFPILYADFLRKQKINVKIKKPFTNRDIKTNEEIEEINKVQKIADKAMQYAINLIKHSEIKNNYLYYKKNKLTSEFLKKEVQEILNNHGLESPDEIIISSGNQTALPHHTGSGPIKAHQPIVMDIFSRSSQSRYFCDMTRTVCKGKPSQKLIDMYNLVLEAQKAGYSKIKNNASAEAVHKAVISVFKSQNMEKYFIHSTGHGLGINIHESPSIPSKTRLKANMVITNEPGLYLPNIGGIRIEDTLVVTKNGYKILTRTPKEFIV